MKKRRLLIIVLSWCFVSSVIAQEEESTAHYCAKINQMTDQQAFERGLNAGFGRCYLFNNDGYFGIMDSSSGVQMSDTFQEGSLAGRALKQLVCAGMCIIF